MKKIILFLLILAVGLISCKESSTEPPQITPPTVTTFAHPEVSSNSSATCGGRVTSDGGSAVTARGVCWSTTLNPTITNNKTTDGTGTGTFVSTVTGLNSGTTYYVRAYATNGVGTGYGPEISFKTIPLTVITAEVTGITSGLATSGGNLIISEDNYLVTDRGVCWSTTSKPTITDNKTNDGSGTGLFVSSIRGLNPVTTYYVRAYATIGGGTSYGSEISFKTEPEKIELGYYYQGGIIFYIDAARQHGLIVTTSVPRANFEEAIKICNDLVLNGYDDWFLPDIDQLKLVWEKRNLINIVSPSFWDQCYWSTTLAPGLDSLYWARVIKFDRTIIPEGISLALKGDVHNVVAIRKF